MVLYSAATGIVPVLAQLIRKVKKCEDNARKSRQTVDSVFCTTVQVNKATKAAAWYSLNTDSSSFE
jgi:hypothetical protein